MTQASRDHGGGLDRAITRWGGARSDWMDLSTGINPEPYSIPALPMDAWTSLPDQRAQEALLAAARTFWAVPNDAAVLAAPGASALIAKLPALAPHAPVHIPGPTYNEHAAAFRAHGIDLTGDPAARAKVLVHPNNPDGRLWDLGDLTEFTVLDESFCDVTPADTLMAQAAQPGVIILKSFGKFWGLAGLRLGFAIGHPDTIAPLTDALGPWPVSGPALTIGATALRDMAWADATRTRLATDTARLDRLLAPHGTFLGGTDLFRLYDVGDANAFQTRLARAHIWTRIFPYSASWVRLGLPPHDGWARLEEALA